jgi:hypothetical protein
LTREKKQHSEVLSSEGFVESSKSCGELEEEEEEERCDRFLEWKKTFGIFRRTVLKPRPSFWCCGSAQ